MNRPEDDDGSDEYAKAWLESRPQIVKDMMVKYPPNTCYKSTIDKGHYHLYSFEENEKGEINTCSIIHLNDSFAPGFRVFNFKISDLKKCGCLLKNDKPKSLLP